MHFRRRVEIPLLERYQRRLVRSALHVLSRTCPYGGPGRPMVTGLSKRPEKAGSRIWRGSYFHVPNTNSNVPNTNFNVPNTNFNALHFWPICSIFDDMLDFPLVNAQILVTELPRHSGMSPFNLQAFIVQFPFRSTFQGRRGQNLGCFATIAF